MSFVPFANSVDCIEQNEQVIENGVLRIVFAGHPLRVDITKDKRGLEIARKLLSKGFVEQKDLLQPMMALIVKSLESEQGLPDGVHELGAAIDEAANPFV